MSFNAGSMNPAPHATAPEIELSVIAPAYNEAAGIAPLVQRLADVFTPLRMAFEVIIVDDGSTDDTRKNLLELSRRHPWLRVIGLTQNSGQTAAMDAGFKAARGRIWATLDADLQNDPAEIPRLMALLGPDVDMVNGWRQKRRDNAWRRVQTRIANAVRNALSGETIHDSACSLKVYKRPCLQGLTLYRGMHRFLPTLVKMRGYRVIEIPVSHHPRAFGATKYKFGDRAVRAFIDLLAVRWMKNRWLRYQTEELTGAAALGVNLTPPQTAELLES